MYGFLCNRLQGYGDMTSFSASVSKWTEKATRNQVLVFRSATQDLVDAVLLSKHSGGNMPIDTGNLRRSLMGSTAAMPTVQRGVTDFPDNSGQISLTIAGAKLTDTIYLGFQAPYALRMEYGFIGEDAIGRYYNQSGNQFVGLAAQRWQEFVDNAAKDIGS